MTPEVWHQYANLNGSNFPYISPWQTPNRGGFASEELGSSQRVLTSSLLDVRLARFSAELHDRQVCPGWPCQTHAMLVRGGLPFHWYAATHARLSCWEVSLYV